MCVCGSVIRNILMCFCCATSCDLRSRVRFVDNGILFCLFTCMPEYVIGEVLLAAKALAADLATERRLVCMGAHMVG